MEHIQVPQIHNINWENDITVIEWANLRQQANLPLLMSLTFAPRIGDIIEVQNIPLRVVRIASKTEWYTTRRMITKDFGHYYEVVGMD